MCSFISKACNVSGVQKERRVRFQMCKRGLSCVVLRSQVPKLFTALRSVQIGELGCKTLHQIPRCTSLTLGLQKISCRSPCWNMMMCRTGFYESVTTLLHSHTIPALITWATVSKIRARSTLQTHVYSPLEPRAYKHCNDELS